MESLRVAWGHLRTWEVAMGTFVGTWSGMGTLERWH